MTQELTNKEKDITEAISKLNNKEASAYKYFLASINRKEATEIPEEKQESLYLLYQTGKSCEEIRRLNHPNYSLGQIVCARITGRWDQRLDDYRETLTPAVQEQVVQVQLESAAVIADMIVACNRLFSDQIKRFIQTGNKADLKGTPLETITFKQYQELIKTLLTVTGQDNNKTVTVKGTVTHEAPTVRRGMSMDRAAELLKAATEEK